jgi:H+/Cl- antiporter ClcA
MAAASARYRNVARKSWIILNAIAAGITAFLILVAAAFFLGAILGDSSNWLDLVFAKYVLFPAVIVGATVCCVVARTLLRKLAAEDSKPVA